MVRLSLEEKDTVSLPMDDNIGTSSRKESRPLLFDSANSHVIDGGTIEGQLNSLHDMAVDDEFGKARTESAGMASGKEKLSSNFQTMMHLLKSNLGTGILAMPAAFSNAGLLVGTLGIPFMGLICIHCMHILVNCSKLLSQRIGARSLGYDSVVYYAFAMGPNRLQRFAKVARGIVNFFLLLTQFGFCCVYFVFVATSFKETINNITGSNPISFIGYVSILLPFLIAINLTRSLQTLAYFSTIANVLQAVGMVIIFVDLLQDLQPVSSRPLSVPISKLPLYFGVAVYAFEGIGVVLPLENEMKTPGDFAGLSGVLNTGMVIVSCLYTGMGFYGFLKYGSDSQGSITLNLPHTYLNESVRLMFAVAIFLSYSIQLYVPVQIVWPFLKRRFSLDIRFSETQLAWIERGFRTLAVLGTYLFAIAIPNLKVFIALVGALASSSLALIIPPILEAVTYWEEPLSRLTWYWMSIKNIFICIFGVVGLFAGTYATIVELQSGTEE